VTFDRVAVDIYTDDPRLFVLMDPGERPAELTTPTEIFLTPFEAGLVRDLPPGEKVSAVVIDWFTERVLVVMPTEEPGEYTAAVHPEGTEELARRLRP
jgi:hypothetical protein